MSSPRRIKFSSAVLIPVVLTCSWFFLDASPSLWVYDAILTIVRPNSRFHKLKGRTVWVTGASSGIGAEIVCHLVQAGAKHVIMSARREEQMEEVAEVCRNQVEGSIETVISILPFDASIANVDHVARKAVDLSGGIDLLVLNAGIYQLSPALETDIHNVQTVMKVNFEAPVALSSALIKADKWKEKRSGHLVVVSSVMGLGGHSLCSTYVASKHALRGYFHTLSTEEHAWLRVDVAMPGATDTGLWTTAFQETQPSAKGPKMSPQRVAKLILTAAVGPHFLFYETVQSKNIGLIWVLLSNVPYVFQLFINILGTVRVSIWEHDRSDALDLPTLLAKMIKMMWKS